MTHDETRDELARMDGWNYLDGSHARWEWRIVEEVKA